jgi:cytochrome d ubiquinol oxidase subunit I
MGYEVLSAFFLEAGFLGVMLFGRERVGKNLHMFATLMVALGTFLSAFWILSANSWMHTPAGYAVNADGQFVPASWWAIVFNPSFPTASCTWCWRPPHHGLRGRLGRRLPPLARQPQRACA